MLKIHLWILFKKVWIWILKPLLNQETNLNATYLVKIECLKDNKLLNQKNHFQVNKDYIVLININWQNILSN